MPEVRPHGTWPSPLSAAELAAGGRTPAELAALGGRVAWVESRPDEGGRQALLVHEDGAVHEVTPAGWNTRTLVHEYGGASFVLGADAVWASSFADQRLHRIGPEGPVPVTTEPARPRATRWADGRAVGGDLIVAVRETHPDGGGEARNEVVALDVAAGDEHVLVTGRDFVAAPRVSPDGAWLLWLAWDHPSMPWDAAELWVARFHGDHVTDAERVLGDAAASVTSPVWLPDGRIACSHDPSGFWEVHVGAPGTRFRAISEFGADCGVPAWQFGTQTIAPLPDGRLACVLTEAAWQRLVVVDPDRGTVDDVELPYAVLASVSPTDDGVAFIGATPTGARDVVRWSPETGPRTLRRYDLDVLRPGDRALPTPIEVATPDGAVTHAILHAPANADVVGPEGERPPLVVFTHGGPTGNAHPVLTAAIAYWTTRGFAVADVNYRGSSGHGRAYREALYGQWGVLDVVDTIAVATDLARRGVVDGDRMAIRGGSAGGYTTLMVLTEPEHPFACGTSFFGVSDLARLARDTHKFESRYLDQVVGPLPAAAATYDERSPITRVDQLSRPLLVLQGLEDEVVPPSQAEAIVAAAAARGVPHAYLAFEGEQHGFRRAENIVTWLESELAFYGQVMGFTPAGELPTLRLD